LRPGLPEDHRSHLQPAPCERQKAEHDHGSRRACRSSAPTLRPCREPLHSGHARRVPGRSSLESFERARPPPGIVSGSW
jgi:hypothetical protein